MNRGVGLAGRQLFGRRPGRLQQGARRSTRQQHTATRAAGGGGSSGSGGSGSPPGPATPASSGGSRFSWAKLALLPAAAAALLGVRVAGADAYDSTAARLEAEAGHRRAERSLQAAHSWVDAIEHEPGNERTIDADMLLQENHPVLEDDHMFSAFVSKGIVDDLTGYYNKQQRKFYAVVSLGREVCGFPRIVHGGLTAAIIDESFGGLLFALKKNNALNFWGPAYTVHLEVGYKQKIDAGRTVLCTTEIESMEGRKLWMKAIVSDGPDGVVYATARALFVAPKPTRMVQDVGRYLLRRVFGDI